MRLGIILVHYHTPRLLQAAVKRLGGIRAELIAVDNGSSPEDQELLGSLPVRWIRPGENLGYAGAINLAMEHSHNELMIFMNPDVEVAPGCVEQLTEVLRGNIAASGPKFYLDRDKLITMPINEPRTRLDELLRRMSTRGRFWSRLARIRWRSQARKSWRTSGLFLTPDLSGALVAFKRTAWDIVGPMDDGFFLYFEESDWLKRLYRMGLRAAYVPQAKAIHHFDQACSSNQEAGRHFGQSHQRFALRYYGSLFCRFLSTLKPGPSRSVGKLVDSPPKVPVGLGWLELSRSPHGFPAADIKAPGPVWSFTSEVWEQLAPGTWYLRQVCGTWAEGEIYRFERD